MENWIRHKPRGFLCYLFSVVTSNPQPLFIPFTAEILREFHRSWLAGPAGPISPNSPYFHWTCSLDHLTLSIPLADIRSLFLNVHDHFNRGFHGTTYQTNLQIVWSSMHTTTHNGANLRSFPTKPFRVLFDINTTFNRKAFTICTDSIYLHVHFDTHKRSLKIQTIELSSHRGRECY